MYLQGIWSRGKYSIQYSQCFDISSLAVTSKETPIHLFDAFTGDLRCSYRAYDHVVSAVKILFVLLSAEMF